MEDIGRVVQHFPPFGHIGLQDKGPRRYVRADFVPQELTVDETQRSMGLEADREMGIKVDRVIPGQTEDTAPLRLPRFRPPECWRVMGRPERQRGTRGEAGFEQLAAAEALDRLG